MPSGTHAALVASAVVAVAALAGCGQNLPRDEFLDRAGAVCARAEQRIAALPRVPSGDFEAIAEFASEAKPVAAEWEAALGKIIPPRDTTPEYGELIIHVADLVEQFEELGDAARDRSAEEVATVRNRIESTASKAADTAAQIGLERCVQAAQAVVEEVGA